MRLAGFYGLTAFNLLLLDENFDVCNKISMVNADMNSLILADLYKEFTYLAHTLDNFPFTYDCEGKNEARFLMKKCTIKEGVLECPPDVEYNDLLYALATHVVLLILRSNDTYNLSFLLGKSGIDLQQAMMQLSDDVLHQIDKADLLSFDRKFRELYTGNGVDITTDLVKAFSVEIGVNSKISLSGNVYELNDDQKKVILWLKSKRDRINVLRDSINLVTSSDDMVFGVPFPALISRKPTCLYYAVNKKFDYAKNANREVLLSVIADIKDEIERFIMLVQKEVVFGELAQSDYLTYDMFLEKSLMFEHKKRSFFMQNVLGIFKPTDFSTESFNLLSDIYDIAHAIDLDYINSVLNTEFNSNTFYKEIDTLNKLGFGGLNINTVDLFEKSIRDIMLSVSSVYEKSEEYHVELDNVLGDIKALLSTLRPIGGVLDV